MQHVVWDDILKDNVKRQIKQFDSAVEDRLNEQGFLNKDAKMSTFYIEDKPNLSDRIKTEMTPSDDIYGDTVAPAS